MELIPVLKLLTPAEGKKHWRLYEPDNKLPRCVSPCVDLFVNILDTRGF
jgi:hypothetical protein